MMVAEGKTFRHKQSGEYETTHLQTPFRIIALMLSRLYYRADGKFCNFGWILVMYYVAMEGRIFNWADIVTSLLGQMHQSSSGRLAAKQIKILHVFFSNRQHTLSAQVQEDQLH